MTAFFRPIALVCLGVMVLPGFALAQLEEGGPGFQRNASRPNPRPQSGPAPAPIAPRETPRQRLDAGAMLCQTEADLQQHETAIAARLDGQFAAEPIGCRPVRTMIPVTVLGRHGPARTQVKLRSAPEQTGWTDAVVRD